jgi:RND family efflux transporter MFP subunit
MTRQVAIWKQLFVITILAGFGYAAWEQRARISEFTGISFSKEASERSRRGGRSSDGVPVIVEPVTLAQSVDRVQAIGDGRSKRSVTLYPEVSGLVSEIDFDAGDRLEEGDVVVKLNDREERLTVDIAKAKVAEARRKVDRYEALIGRNAIPMAQVDTARSELRTAELELEQARESLSDRTVRAPFSGVVGIAQVEVGDRVSDATAITNLDDRSRIFVEFEVPEIYLTRIEVGQPITATSASFRDRTFEGRVTEINSRIDPQSRSVRLRAALKNSDDLLRGGMSFNVTITLEGERYPSIPELSLLWARDGSHVWSVADGKAEKVPVSVVKRADGRVLVAGDLKAGQLVVVEGTQRLRPGRALSFDRPEATAQKEAGL